MDTTFLTYSLYLAISIALTVWVARTLHRNGRVFLVEAFQGREPLADSVNHLLVVGFYLVNLGFVSLYLEGGMRVATATQALEALSAKLGVVMLVLGAMHFFNISAFNRWRNRGRLEAAPPPVSPSGHLMPPPPPYHQGA